MRYCCIYIRNFNWIIHNKVRARTSRCLYLNSHGECLFSPYVFGFYLIIFIIRWWMIWSITISFGIICASICALKLLCYIMVSIDTDSKSLEWGLYNVHVIFMSALELIHIFCNGFCSLNICSLEWQGPILYWHSCRISSVCHSWVIFFSSSGS